MTSDQRTSGSGGGYIKQRHLLQEGMDYDPVVDGARNLRQYLSWLMWGWWICLPDDMRA